MNAKMKEQLEAVVESIVNDDTDAAKVAFHEYLRLKSQAYLLGESDEECDDDMKDDKKDDEKSDDKSDDKKDDKKDDKEDKKPAFLKKSDDKKDD